MESAIEQKASCSCNHSFCWADCFFNISGTVFDFYFFGNDQCDTGQILGNANC